MSVQSQGRLKIFISLSFSHTHYIYIVCEIYISDLVKNQYQRLGGIYKVTIFFVKFNVIQLCFEESRKLFTIPWMLLAILYLGDSCMQELQVLH